MRTPPFKFTLYSLRVGTSIHLILRRCLSDSGLGVNEKWRVLAGNPGKPACGSATYRYAFYNGHWTLIAPRDSRIQAERKETKKMAGFCPARKTFNHKRYLQWDPPNFSTPCIRRNVEKPMPNGVVCRGLDWQRYFLPASDTWNVQVWCNQPGQ